MRIKKKKQKSCLQLNEQIAKPSQVKTHTFDSPLYEQ